jgi:(E)-4-hydroxy-3-methyl-but-2-enyl pyrophosphate reductase
MARVKLAKNAGFCMGVRRAMDMTLEAIVKKGGSIHTYGPLIHNPQVLEILKGKGVESLPEEGGKISLPVPTGKDPVTLIIRAHGVSSEERQRIRDTGLKVINATCPHVGRVQSIIKRFSKQGYATVILGERDHAEVMGLLGYAGGHGYVINSLEELAGLPSLGKVCFVAQTTQDEKLFKDVAEAVREKFPEARVFNTICDSTRRRQEEVISLAKRVEAIVVVGGKGSGNTRRLAKISTEMGVPTFHVETEKELNLEKLSAYSLVGVTAGASTPTWQILRVIECIKTLQREKGPYYFMERLGRFLAVTYIFLALGAAFLTYASVLIQGLTPKPSSILISSFYVFSMHVINRLQNKDSEWYNQPGRMEFYERYGQWMLWTAVFSVGIALTLAAFEGIYPFLLILAIAVLGLIYNLPVFPATPDLPRRFRRLRDIPGSKTLFVSLAWGVVTSLLPPLAGEGWIHPATAVAFFFTTGFVLLRSTLYDFKDIQGDLLVGKETIPTVLGWGNTKGLVVLLTILLAGNLVFAFVMGWVPSIAILLLLSLSYVAAYYGLYRKRILGRGFLFEWTVDGSFIFAGLLGFIWKIP